MEKSVYKILTEAQFLEFKATGSFAGTPLDLRDGYLHLSVQSQVAGVIARYFAGQRPLYVVEFSPSVFAHHLRWEASSSGEIFPHVYGRALQFSEVVSVSLPAEKVADV